MVSLALLVFCGILVLWAIDSDRGDQGRVVIISKSQVARQVEKPLKIPKEPQKAPKSSHDRWSEPARRERQPAWGRPGSENITTLDEGIVSTSSMAIVKGCRQEKAKNVFAGQKSQLPDWYSNTLWETRLDRPGYIPMVSILRDLLASHVQLRGWLLSYTLHITPKRF